MRRVSLAASLAIVLMLAGCGGEQQAPGDGTVEQAGTGTEKFANWEAAAQSLGSGEDCGARSIVDSIATKEAGEAIMVTWWNGKCGEVGCAGIIVAEPEQNKAHDSGSCGVESRWAGFEGEL